MKRIILDHFQRWGWVLALCALITFLIGVFIAANPDVSFEFWLLLVTMWAGGNKLGSDIKQGLVRSFSVLPLTGRQIGRSWWLATVAIPAIVLSALLFLGAETCCLFEPGRSFPLNQLVRGSFFTLTWLATMFALVLPSQNLLVKRKGRTLAVLITNFSMVMLFGSMALCINASKSATKSAAILGGGAILLFAGWFRADRFVLGKSNCVFIPGTPFTAKNARAETGIPTGTGGTRYLLTQMVTKMVLYGLSVSAGILLLLFWLVQTKFSPNFINLATYMSFWTSVLAVISPLLCHMRFLRTLPVSATGFATLLLAIAIIPFIILGLFWAGVAGLLWGSTAVTAVITTYTFWLAPFSVTTFLMIWTGKQGWVFAIIPISILYIKVEAAHVPFQLIASIVALCIVLSFFLTRLVFLRSGRPYRIITSASEGLLSNVGR